VQTVKCDSISPIISLSLFRAGSTSAMMIGGGVCIGGRVVKMMPGMTVAEFPCGRFRRKPPLNIQTITARDSQTNTR